MSLMKLILSVFLMLFLAANVAMALGVGPSALKFEKVLRGGYAEQTLIIMNTADAPIEIKVQKEGEVAEWLRFYSRENTSFNPASFIIGPRANFQLQVIVTPPLDAQVRVYDGRLTVISSSPKDQPEGNVLGIETAVAASVRIELTGEQIVDYAVDGVQISDAEEGLPIMLAISGENKGNVRIKPNIHVDILDRDKKNVLRSLDLTGSEVLPTTKKIDVLNITNDLQIGQYWAVVNVSVSGKQVYSQILTFDVFEKGSLRVKGELVRIDNEIWAEIGDVVKINAIFKNTGELSVNAKFKGEVYFDGKIVGLLESEELIVPAGEEMQLPTFFTPQKDGRHAIKGAVYYSKKVTFEKDGVINVLPARFSIIDILAGGAIYAVIIAAMIFVYISYKKRNNSYERYGKILEKQKKVDGRLEKLTKKSEEMGKKVKKFRKHKK